MAAKKMAIIATKGALDMAYPPLILSSTAAALGWEVQVFFTFYGLQLLRKDLSGIAISPLANPAMPMPVPMPVRSAPAPPARPRAGTPTTPRSTATTQPADPLTEPSPVSPVVAALTPASLPKRPCCSDGATARAGVDGCERDSSPADCLTHTFHLWSMLPT